MDLAALVERNDIARVTAYRWFHAGLLPVPAQREGRLIVVNDAAAESARCGRTAVSARVASADQKAGLDPRVARVTRWAATEQIRVDKVVTEVGFAVSGHRGKVVAVLGDRSVRRIVVAQRDGLCGLGSEYVEGVLAPQGREFVVVDTADVDDDLVGDMTGILTSVCARLFGKRAAQNRAKRAPPAATTEDAQAA